MDGTFANYAVARRNVINCLNKNRNIGIFYLYQDPVIAWDFTKKREKLEGRYVPKESFIKAFFDSKENVKLIKKEFAEKIELNLVIKNKQNNIKGISFNVDFSNIDNLIVLPYNKKSLRKIIC